jgi:hypothetical protein
MLIESPGGGFSVFEDLRSQRNLNPGRNTKPITFRDQPLCARHGIAARASAVAFDKKLRRLEGCIVEVVCHGGSLRPGGFQVAHKSGEAPASHWG